jgi:hypothetical protein
MALAGAVAAGIVGTGAGTAYASDVIYNLAIDGGYGSWDATTHVLTVYDTAADGDTIYAYVMAPNGNFIYFHTAGSGSSKSEAIGSYYDIGGNIEFDVARVNSSYVILNESGYTAFRW